MLDQVPHIFDNMKQMTYRLGKPSYESNMAKFRQEHGHYFDEMISYVEQSEDPETAARELAENFTGQVRSAFEKRGKIGGAVQAGLNSFMVYYVFPAILLTKRESADSVCRSICEAWRTVFPGNKIGYTDYDSIYNAFREKIFGVF